ncbi:MAG: RNA-binding cell elongation regulator Jag/EloR [Eubacteriales bacterium]
MNETYLVMAKTVEEAIAVANREYAHDGKEISYEILEMPKKGFLGIGARDAKIKVTVTESASSQLNAELNSLVADLRGMKVHTNRGGSEADERPRKQNPGQGQGQKKSQNGSQNQGQERPQNQNQERPQNQGQGQRKTEARPPKQQEPKQQEPKRAGAEAEKPQDARPAGTQGSKKEPRHEGQPKPESRPQKQERPVPERPAAEQPVKAEKPERQTEHPVREPKEAKERKEVREPKPAEKKAADGKPAEPKPAEKAPVRTEPAEELPAAPAVPVQEPQAEAAKPEYHSSLRNQAKPQRRPSRPKSQNADAVSEQAEAIIASPVGLSDFTREAAHEEGFGSGAGASGGRMSNDIRRRPRQQQPKPAEKAAEVPSGTAAPVPAAAAEAAEAVEAMEAMEAAAAVEAVEAAEFVEAPEDAEEAASEASEASEAPVVDEDRQKVGVTEAEMQYALDFANTLLRNMAIEAEAKAAACPEGEEYVIEGDANVYPKIDIEGSGTGILIGHHGETLDAVQYLVNLAALRQSRQKGGDYVKIVVDIENYRAKREETLRALARRMAARAVKYKRNVFLEPMNAYERRIIHSELHNFENVSTHSVGTDKNRKIIITYEGPDKVQQPRRERPERQERQEHAERPERADKPEGKSDAKGSASRRSEPRRPKKIQKMPIEKLPDFLASGTTPEDADTFIEIED